MVDNPTIATIISMLGDKRNKPIVVYTLKRTYDGVLRHVDNSANLILDCKGTKVFVKRSGLISFELMRDE